MSAITKKIQKRIRTKICVLVLSEYSFHYEIPGGASWKKKKNLPAKCKRRKRRRFHPWVRKIPWRRAWQPTPVFLPGESHGNRGAWQATVHRVINSRTRLKWLSTCDWKAVLWDFFFKSYCRDKIPTKYPDLELSCVFATIPYLASRLWGCLAHSDCESLTLRSGSWILNCLLLLTQRSHPGRGCCLSGSPSKEKQNSLPMCPSPKLSLSLGT